MPGSLSLATVASGAILPNSLSTAFTLITDFPLLSTSYHDGTSERSLIQDGVNAPRQTRIWKLSKRLTPAQLATLQTFWETVAVGPANPFFFYDPYDVAPGSAIGSNFDATGVSTQGRVTVFFRGNFSFTATIARVNLGELTLVEVA